MRIETIQSTLISQKPDVLVVWPPNIQLLSKTLRRAQNAGIYVISISNYSQYKTDAFVGPNYLKAGEIIAEQMVKDCGKGSGRSGKVSLIQGTLTSTVSIDVAKGFMNVMDKHPEMNVVSNQGTDWVPQKAHDITAAVIQQHPDLCATFGPYGAMMVAANEAVKKAGKRDNVKVYAIDDGTLCDKVADGSLDGIWQIEPVVMGQMVMTTAKVLLQSGLKPGSTSMALYSPITRVTPRNAATGCWKVIEEEE